MKIPVGKIPVLSSSPHLRLIVDPHNDLLLVGLTAQLVEHDTGIAEVRVRAPVQAFLAATLAALKCDNQIHYILIRISNTWKIPEKSSSEVERL